jgi:hypothetical protein
MNRRIVTLVLVALATGAVHAADPTGEGTPTGAKPADPWANYRFAPDALLEIDLASATAWTLSIDGGPARPIKVTAGGWNSDQQTPQIETGAVKDHVIYRRKITIPKEASGNVVKILFGGCTYGAEVFVDDRKVCEHHGAQLPFEADLTGVVTAGKTCSLAVKAFSRPHYVVRPLEGQTGIKERSEVEKQTGTKEKPSKYDIALGFDFNRGFSSQFNGRTRYAYGIIGHVRLAIYPAVYVSDVFVRPSVSQRQLACDVWVANRSALRAAVRLSATLVPHGRKGLFAYPSLPEAAAEIEAGQTAKLTLQSSWELGPDSYWWPNIPFREDYEATLHRLNLKVDADGKLSHERTQRFGFVEYGEGEYFFTVNGVRVTGFGDSNSYGQIGEWDCFSETPCFMPPHGAFKGCREFWVRYQRIGFNSMRLSTSVPTRYMMETADEAGFMLIPENCNWGNGRSVFHAEREPHWIRQMVRWCRNSPCIARYSLGNEIGRAYSNDAYAQMIEAAVQEDPTRPLIFESCGPSRDQKLESRIKKTGHYCGVGLQMGPPGGKEPEVMFARVSFTPQGRPIGMETPAKEPAHRYSDRRLRMAGEYAWCEGHIETFPPSIVWYRMNDWAYFAMWSWLNGWGGFVEWYPGKRHPWCGSPPRDWDSPQVKAMQWAFHPYLVVDIGDVTARPGLALESEPPHLIYGLSYDTIAAGGTTLDRDVEVFNNSLKDQSLVLRWSVRWDGDMTIQAKGEDGPFLLQAGFHVSRRIRVPLPKTPAAGQTLLLKLESVADGQVVFSAERTRICVVDPDAAPTVAFTGESHVDPKELLATRGREAFTTFSGTKTSGQPWLMAANWTRWSAGKEGGSLVRSADAPPDAPLAVVVTTGGEPRNVSLYFGGSRDADLRQTITVLDGSGKTLDSRSVSDFGKGKLLSWTVNGTARFTIAAEPGKDGKRRDSAINAVLLDAAAGLDNGK